MLEHDASDEIVRDRKYQWNLSIFNSTFLFIRMLVCLNASKDLSPWLVHIIPVKDKITNQSKRYSFLFKFFSSGEVSFQMFEKNIAPLKQWVEGYIYYTWHFYVHLNIFLGATVAAQRVKLHITSANLNTGANKIL